MCTSSVLCILCICSNLRHGKATCPSDTHALPLRCPLDAYHHAGPSLEEAAGLQDRNTPKMRFCQFQVVHCAFPFLSCLQSRWSRTGHVGRLGPRWARCLLTYTSQVDIVSTDKQLKLYTSQQYPDVKKQRLKLPCYIPIIVTAA